MSVTPTQIDQQSRNLSPVTSQGRIPELDGLRGLAILLVIICHYVAGSEATRLPAALRLAVRSTSVGWSGVDLFFVLSGFLIGGILLDFRDSDSYFRTFYLRRAFRILPVYYGWIVLYAVFLGLWALRSGDPGRLQNLEPLPYYVCFTQNFFWNKTHLERGWLGATWSLAVEEQFYLCAPIVVRYLSVKGLAWSLAGVVVAAPVLRFLCLTLWGGGYSYLATFAMFCRADALALGILAAIAWRSPNIRLFLRKNPAALKKTTLALVIVVAGLLYWLERPVGVVHATIGYSSLASLYTCLLLIGIIGSPRWAARAMRFRPLRLLGTISYCVYIIHGPIFLGLHTVLLDSEPRIDTLRGASVTVLAFVCTLVVATLSWRFFEKPLLRRGHLYNY